MIAPITSTRLPFAPPLTLQDGELADAIADHACQTIQRGEQVDPDAYLLHIERCGSRFPRATQTAMSAGIRWLKLTGVPLSDAAQVLEQRYPSHKRSVHDAVALERALGSTTLPQRACNTPPDIELPASLGPAVGQDHCHRYELLSEIGTGSYGRVYRAEDRLFDSVQGPTTVAIKLTRPSEHPSVASPEAIKARRVDHPNVVRVLDAGYAEHLKCEYTVFEFVEGGTLCELKGVSDTQDIRDRVELICKVADGVAAIHQSGVIHCDLKPANVLLSSARIPRIADLGTAYSIEIRADEDPSQHGGTPAYMAPELIAGDAPSIYSDVYSLGALGLYLLSGICLISADRLGLIKLHGSGMPADTAEALAIADCELASIIGRAIAQDPAQRYETAGHFRDDLQRWLRREPIMWLKPSPLHRMRLACIRRPFHAMALVAVVVLLGVGLFQWHTLSVNAAVASDWRDRRVAVTEEVYRDLEQSTEGGLGPERHLSMLWYLDELVEQGVLDKTIGAHESIEQLKAIGVEQFRGARPGSLDQLAWGQVAALWHLAGESPAPGGMPIIDQCIQVLDTRFDKADEWRFRTELLATFLGIKERWHNVQRDSQVPAEELAELSQIATELEGTLVRVERDYPYTAMHRENIRWLLALYSSRMLRDRAGRDRMIEMQNAFEARQISSEMPSNRVSR